MEYKVYEIENCPLTPINGIYNAHQDGHFVHENGKFILSTSDGHWQIWMLPIPPEGKPHCMTIAASDSPVSQNWMYFSTVRGRNKYVKSFYMSARYVKNAAKRLPLQKDEPEDSLSNPVLQEDASDDPVHPATQCHTDTDEDRDKTRSSNLPPLLSVEQLPAYTKPIPHMKPGDLASNWKAEEGYNWTGSRTVKYTNLVTHEVRTDKPMALQYHPSVCSFKLRTINRQQVEVFAPAQCIQDLGGHPESASYDESWEKVAPYWSSTVAAYDHEVGNLHAYIKSLQARQDYLAHREVGTNNIIASLEKKLEETQTIEQELRAKELLINSLQKQLDDFFNSTTGRVTERVGSTSLQGDLESALATVQLQVAVSSAKHKELESARSHQQVLQASLNKAQGTEQELRATIAALEASNSSLKAQLEEIDLFPVKECPPPPPPSSDTISTLSTTTDLALGKKHVLRDAPVEADSVFPSGTEIRAEFLLVSARIEDFAFNAMNCLEDLGQDSSDGFFVGQVMVPLHRVTQEYVAGLVETQREHLIELCGESARWVEGSNAAARSPHREFFLATQQSLLLERVEQLDEARIIAFIAELGPTAGIIQEAMQAPTFQGIVEDGLRLNQLVRCLLRLHILALLSDPRCHLLPPPGERLLYQPHLHTEIISPGVKRYGYIKEGEEVEVVFCGLCFRPADLEPPTSDPVEVSSVLGKGLDKPPPLVPALVRRVVADGR